MSAENHGPVDWLPTRQSLLSRLKNWNDQESWRVFFDTYWRLIYNTARKAGLSDAEAQDVVQETIIGVSRQMPHFHYTAEGSFKAWLLQLTRWRVADQLRKRQPGYVAKQDSEPPLPDLESLEEVEDPAGRVLDGLWDEEWENNLMEVALERVKRQVNPKQFQIFDLHVRQDWPVSKVARALKVNTATVYVVKHRVARLMKKEVIRLRARPM